jgi:hypothetical protein
VIRPEVFHFATIEAAEAAATPVGIHLFLGAGELALVARGVEDDRLTSEVHLAEARDRRSYSDASVQPGDLVVSQDCCTHRDDAPDTSWPMSWPWVPEEMTERLLKQSLAIAGRHNVVEQHGTRITRGERSSSCLDGSGRNYTSRAVVVDCLSIEEARTRFWDSVGELWRTAAGHAPHLAIIGAIEPNPTGWAPTCTPTDGSTTASGCQRIGSLRSGPDCGRPVAFEETIPDSRCP